MTVVDFTHIWNTIPFPAFVINSNLNIIEGNSAAEQIVHTSQSHMIGKNLGLFFFFVIVELKFGSRSTPIVFIFTGIGLSLT